MEPRATCLLPGRRMVPMQGSRTVGKGYLKFTQAFHSKRTDPYPERMLVYEGPVMMRGATSLTHCWVSSNASHPCPPVTQAMASIYGCPVGRLGLWRWWYPGCLEKEDVCAEQSKPPSLFPWPIEPPQS